MSATADHAEERTSPAVRLGFQPEQVVQEIGYDDDVDQELRESIEEVIGSELVDEEYDDVADAVVLWFRDEDGDLTDVLVDALKLPFVLVPTVNGDNNQHARDENLRLGHFITGTEAILALLSTPYP